MEIFHSIGFFFFFNDTATTEIYPLSLHDALPIFDRPIYARYLHRLLAARRPPRYLFQFAWKCTLHTHFATLTRRSEEHTSELQSQSNLVCRLLLEKKKTTQCCGHPLSLSTYFPVL